VEQLQHPLVAVELTQRRYSGVGKRAVGFFENLFEVGIRNAAGHERTHHPEGQLVVRQTGPGSDFFLGKARQVFRHIQTAITGQTGQQHIFKIQGRCLATGTDIAHGFKPSVRAASGLATAARKMQSGSCLPLVACSLQLLIN